MPDIAAGISIFILGGLATIAKTICNGLAGSFMKSITANINVDIPVKHIAKIKNLFESLNKDSV